MSLIAKPAYTVSPKALEPGTEIDLDYASLSPAEAFLHDGLWPLGATGQIYQLEPLSTPSLTDGRVKADGWKVVRQADSREALAEVSETFVDFETEMNEEQALWRRALARPKSDPTLVRSNLEHAVRARGLKHWKLEQMPARKLLKQPIDGPSMHAWSSMTALKVWQAFEVEAREDEVYDTVRRHGWTLWYQPRRWNEFAPESPPDFDDVPAPCWDAWVALSTWYAASAGFVDVVPEAYTLGVRTAYLYGLAMVRPIDRGVLGWSMA